MNIIKIFLCILFSTIYAKSEELTIFSRCNSTPHIPGQLPMESRKIILERGNKLEVLIHSMGIGRGVPGSNFASFSTIYKDLIVFVISESDEFRMEKNMYLYVFRQVQAIDEVGIAITLPQYTLIKKTLLNDKVQFTSDILQCIGSVCQYDCKDDFLQIEVNGKNTFSKKISLKD